MIDEIDESVPLAYPICFDLHAMDGDEIATRLCVPWEKLIVEGGDLVLKAPWPGDIVRIRWRLIYGTDDDSVRYSQWRWEMREPGAAGIAIHFPATLLPLAETSEAVH